jgi:hypothetical protein
MVFFQTPKEGMMKDEVLGIIRNKMGKAAADKAAEEETELWAIWETLGVEPKEAARRLMKKIRQEITQEIMQDNTHYLA